MQSDEGQERPADACEAHRPTDLTLPEALAEIERLCAENRGLFRDWTAVKMELERLRERVAYYEAIAATRAGTLAEPQPDEPFSITRNVPGNVPT